MKKFIKLGSMFLVIAVLCFVYAHIDKMHPVFNEEVDPAYYGGTAVGSTEEFQQVFVSGEEYIDGVALKFGATGERLQEVNLIYSIESQNGQVLATGKLEGSKFKHQKYNVLEIDRIQNVKDRALVFKCHLENTDEENGISISKEGENLVMKYYTSRFDLETFVIACALCAYVVVFMKILFKMFKE